MSYSTQVLPLLCTLEPLRNPKQGLSPLACAGPARAILRGDPPTLLQVHHTTQLPCTPLRETSHLGMEWGGKEKGGCGRRASPCSLSGQLLSEGVGWRKVFLLPCLLVTTGKQASNSWPLALLACWQAASTGKRREGESEGGSEAAGCPTLPGWQVSGRPIGLFLLPVSPFLFFPSAPGGSLPL